MPFIGNQPALSYTSFAKQDFTTSATTSYTLDHPVTNANELALFINFVRQEPTTAYTASGTSLTLTSATSASDDMYCVFLGKAVQTVNPPSGSVGTAQLVDGQVTNAKLQNSSITLNGSAVSLGGSATVGGTNTPSFGAKLSSNQSLTTGTYIKMQLATELWDTDSAFDNSTNYRFTVPSDKAGRYMFVGSGNIGNISDGGDIRMSFYKNGSDSNQGKIRYFAGGGGVGIYFTSSAVIDLSVGDYIELYQFATSGNHFAADETYLYGYKIIE